MIVSCEKLRETSPQIIKNIKIKIEYDGTNFLGFQKQAQGRTIQGEIEKALYIICGSQIKTIGGGRTDSGVHAKGQILNFKTTKDFSVDTWVRALNGNLPDDISVIEASEVPMDFHARYSAIARHYRYKIFNRKIRSPLFLKYMYWFPYELDKEAMKTSWLNLVGTWDFSACCKSISKKGNMKCTVINTEFKYEDNEIILDIIANRFLHGMVRSLVGTLLLVGNNKIKVKDFINIIKSGKRELVGSSVPAHGLCLMNIIYN